LTIRRIWTEEEGDGVRRFEDALTIQKEGEKREKEKRGTEFEDSKTR